MNAPNRPRPVVGFESLGVYDPRRSKCPTDLRLDGNEGRAPAVDLVQRLAEAGGAVMHRYPDRRSLEARLASALGLTPACVLVTAGADEALDRICRAYLDSDRNLATTTPTFEMIPRYTALSGAGIRQTPWPGGTFPVDALLETVDRRTGVIVVVSPNNPTGATATADDLRRLSAAAPGSLLVVDLAYGEFADTDLTPVALALPNAIAVRTLSKAWGLAGLRVGYACGPPELITPLRSAGGPYAVAGPSLMLAAAALSAPDDRRRFIDRVREERGGLRDELQTLGASPAPSQGNFVYAEFEDPLWVRDGLAGLGIAVRLFAGPDGGGHLRISCPGDSREYERLQRGLRTVLAPEALLLDMDGVLADVNGSYRRAIIRTAAGFGRTLTAADVAAAKRRPGSNNDWVLTRDLLAAYGVDVDLSEVTDRFQANYRELAVAETLIPDRDLLRRLAGKIPLAIVTGRPRAEAEAFLERYGIRDLFEALVGMEDAPGKPDPAPLRLALKSLGVDRAWMIGDTVNDVAAARAAGVMPLGVVPPDESASDYPDLLVAAGAGRVLDGLDDLEEVLR